ncbi:MAG: amidohydrolase family protein [Candidatus Hadarchaeales archaeon]
MEKLLIRDGYLVTMDAKRRVLKRGSVLVEGNRIVEVKEEIKESADVVIDAKGMAVLPGLVNAHTHSPMTLFRGVADDMELDRWLKEKIWPVEARLRAEDCYVGALLACAEMIKSGTTCFADMYFFMEKVAEAVGKSGLRASLSYGMIELGIPGRCEEELKKGEKLVKEYHGSFGGRVQTMFGPHAPYTCSPECLRKVKEKAEKYGVGIHIHLSETEREVRETKEKYGKTPVELLHSIGLLAPNLLAAHCVWVDEKEMELMAKSGMKPVHNPTSNLKLASGISPVPNMLERGIPVALGTDGAASNNSLDMFQEMKVAALIHKGWKRDPTLLSAQTVLEMATLHGAEALGREKEIGSIEKGKKADLILVDLRNLRFSPLHHVLSHLVYASTGELVDTVIVDGKVLMRKRKLLTLDEEEVLKMAEETASELFEEGDFKNKSYEELAELEDELEKKKRKRGKYRAVYRKAHR